MYKKNKKYKIANHTTNVNKNAKFNSCLFAKFKTALRTFPNFGPRIKFCGWINKFYSKFKKGGL